MDNSSSKKAKQKQKQKGYIMHNPGENSAQFISLSEAAKILDTTRDYLNVLVHRGKLKAKKIGRNWATTQDAINKYLAEKGNPADSTQNTTHSDKNHLNIELEKYRLEVELEKARLNHQENLARIESDRLIQLKKIEKDERVELKAVRPEETIAEADEEKSYTPRLPEIQPENSEKSKKEKQEIIDFFSQHLEKIKKQLESEQTEKHSLLLELEQLREQIKQINQSRVNELVQDWREKDDVKTQIEFLRDSFSQALQDYRIEAQQNIQGHMSQLEQSINEQLAESKITDALSRMKEKMDMSVREFEEESLPGDFKLINLNELDLHYFSDKKGVPPAPFSFQENKQKQNYEFLEINFPPYLPQKNKWKSIPLHSDNVHHVAKLKKPFLGIKAYVSFVTVVTLLILGGYGLTFSPAPEMPDVDKVKNQVSKLGTEIIFPAAFIENLGTTLFDIDNIAKIGTQKLYFAKLGEAWAEKTLDIIIRFPAMRTDYISWTEKPLVNTNSTAQKKTQIKIIANEASEFLYDTGYILGKNFEFSIDKPVQLTNPLFQKRGGQTIEAKVAGRAFENNSKKTEPTSASTK